MGLELDAVELGNAVDQIGHRLAEFFADFGLGDFGVFHHVVQECRGQRLRVEMEFGEYVGDRQRVRDVRVAGSAELAAVRGFAEVVSGFYPRDVFRLEVAGPFLEESGGFGRCAGGRGHDGRRTELREQRAK